MKNKKICMDKNEWKQINEEQEDYQYFKRYDDEKLKKELDSIKQNGYAGVLTASC